MTITPTFPQVEGGRIDHALHDNRAQLALEEVLELDLAVNAALSLLDPKDSLVVVLADHSHGMTVNGYQPRGSDILGKYLQNTVLYLVFNRYQSMG